jgi:sugar transferase (PEP-CTERM/EpsH1 system associated)
MLDILFLAHRVPYPPDRGDKIRSWHILKALCGIANVHVAALCDDMRDMAHLRFLNRYAATIGVFPRNAARDTAAIKALVFGGSASVRAFGNRDLSAYVSDVLREQDVATIFAFSGQMAQYVPRNVGTRRFVMDFVDMDSAKYAAWGQARGLIGAANRFEARRLLTFERETASRADASLFVSEAEASLFQQRTGISKSKIHVLSNGIDFDHFVPAEMAVIEHNLVVFTGQMDYAPNVEAVVDFVRDVWPMVQAKVPGARFAIVGRNPVADVRALASGDVIVTGEVDDTRQWLARAVLAVAPLKLARGVQNKILEAMAMAKPVVASSAAAQGIGVSIDQHLLVADSPDAQAAAIVGLLSDPDRSVKMGLAARAELAVTHGWDTQLANLPSLVGAT